MLKSNEIGRRVSEAMRPPPKFLCREWVPRNFVLHQETETPGPFDLDLMPHVAGVLDAADDPSVREIYLPWATRNGKTQTSIAILMALAVNAPRPAVVMGPDKDTAKRTIDEYYYPALEACDATKPQLLPDHKRNEKFIRLERSRIRRGFAGSPSSLAGFPACYGHVTEASKQFKGGSTEADPIRLVRQRAKLYPFESKYIYESSPGLKGHCRITELVDAPTTQRRRRWVPCPHCGEYQLLTFGKPGVKGGIKWEKAEDGRSETLLAERTAYYECALCEQSITNADRPLMMRSGVWLPEGQSIDRRGRIRGTPNVQSGNVAFAPLSSLYSLAISGWGWVAREFLVAKAAGRDAIRDFVNGILGEAWDPAPQNANLPRLVSDRLCVETHVIGTVPDWGRVITMAIDVQLRGRLFPWVACGWGTGGRGGVIDFGAAAKWDDIDGLLARQWPHADGGPPMSVTLAGIDSGDETDDVYAFVRARRKLLAIKGMSRAFDLAYKIDTLEHAQVELLGVNSDRLQRWVQRIIDGHPEAAEGDKDEEIEGDADFILPANCALAPMDFIHDLINEYETLETDRNGYVKRVWKKRHGGKPNDWRDCVRYCRTLALVLTEHGTLWDRLPPRAVRREELAPQLARPDDRQPAPFVRPPSGWRLGRSGT